MQFWLDHLWYMSKCGVSLWELSQKEGDFDKKYDISVKIKSFSQTEIIFFIIS